MPASRRRAVLVWGVRAAATVLVGVLAFAAVLAYPRSHVAGNGRTGPVYPAGYGKQDPLSPRVAWGPGERTVLYTERIGPRCYVRSVHTTSLAPFRIEVHVDRVVRPPCTYPERSRPYVLRVPAVAIRGKPIRVSLGYRVLVLHWPGGG